MALSPAVGIVDEDPVLPTATKEVGNAMSCLPKPRLQFTAEESRRIGFHFEPCGFCCLKHDTRRGAIAAVVQVIDPIDEPEVGAPLITRLLHLSHGANSERQIRQLLISADGN